MLTEARQRRPNETHPCLRKPAARASCRRSRSRTHWAETGADQAGNEQFCTATLATYNA